MHRTLLAQQRRLLGLAQTSLWRGSIDLSLFCGWVSL
jgi:hypothetical protein